MPDIISRIRLEAQGADQVSREIGKIKDAYDDVAESKEGLIRATDPFSRAVMQAEGADVGGGGGGGAGVALRNERTRAENENYNRRMAEHYRPSQAGGFQGTMQAARLGRGTMTAAEGVDPMGAVQGGGGLLALVKGLNPLLVGLGVLLGVSAGAITREFGLVGEQYGGGVPQRLGTNYGASRWFQINQARRGIPLQMLQGMMEGFGGAGGRYDENYMAIQGEVMERYGISPQIMGQTMATLQRGDPAFAAGGRMTGERNLQLLARTFGVGRTGPAMQGIAQILEDAMARGARRGSDILQGGMGAIAREIAGYAQFGGLSMEGAIGLAGRRRERFAAGARPQTPLDVLTIRAMMEETGEDLFTVQERISRGEGRDIQARIVRRMSGGDRSFAGRMYMGQDLTPSLAGVAANELLGIGQGGLDYGKGIPVDVMARTAMMLKQLMTTHGMGVGFLKLITDVYNAFMGEDTGEPAKGIGAHLRDVKAPDKIDKEAARLAEQTQKTGPATEEDFRKDAEGNKRTGEEQLGTFFDTLQKLEDAAKQREETNRLLGEIDSKLPGEQ